MKKDYNNQISLKSKLLRCSGSEINTNIINVNVNTTCLNKKKLKYIDERKSCFFFKWTLKCLKLSLNLEKRVIN